MVSTCATMILSCIAAETAWPQFEMLDSRLSVDGQLGAITATIEGLQAGPLAAIRHDALGYPALRCPLFRKNRHSELGFNDSEIANKTRHLKESSIACQMSAK